jgi:hypothetical protein
MHAINHAELAVVHVLTHLSALTASEAKVVLKALARGVELVANAVQLACRVEVRKSYSLSHCLSFWNHF